MFNSVTRIKLIILILIRGKLLLAASAFTLKSSFFGLIRFLDFSYVIVETVKQQKVVLTSNNCINLFKSLAMHYYGPRIAVELQY